MRKKSSNTQQNKKNRFCKDKTLDHMIIECNKLAQKQYKARHNKVGKMIY